MSRGNDEPVEQVQALNGLLVEMARTQKANIRSLIRIYVITVICFTVLIISGFIGFLWYESQFQYTPTTTETITQEVSGTDSEINNIEGNLYRDNAIHNQGGDN